MFQEEGPDKNESDRKAKEVRTQTALAIPVSFFMHRDRQYSLLRPCKVFDTTP